MYDLHGKTALVTGAGGERGIGRAIAVRLAREGADVIVNDLSIQSSTASDWGGLTAVVQEIEALGRRALAIQVDISDADSVDRMVRQVLRQFGRIDILVNNAAAPAGRDRRLVVDLEEDAWDLVQRVNVKGTFLCSRAVARAMIEVGQGGRIINIASTAGLIVAPRYAAYCASKFAVRGFTQALALELGPHGINVNAICPSFVDTERLERIAAALAPEGVSAEAYHQQMVEQAESSYPLGRIGKTSDVASAAAFLASAQSDFITGVSIIVAGGQVTT